MAASRLFHLSSSLLRSAQRRSFLSSPLSLLGPSHQQPHRLSPISILRPLPNLRLYASNSAVAADTEEPASAVAASHPWPEWDHFLYKLRSKGYFAVPSSTASPAEDVDESPVADGAAELAATMELNRVKNACLKFARERFDILRSLPKEDIEAIVECGCPNLFRKAVNSAKRLRAFLKLDEGDVCSMCNLKGSCDKAYVIAKEDEPARTVDVIRIILTYAVNPAALSGVENPPVNLQIQESARKLLSELIKLSDTTIDPALPKPVVQSPSQKEPSQKSVRKNNSSQNAEMKRGDWLCPNCNFLNFARNVRCLECKEDGPKRVNFKGAEMKLGDWTCPKCEFMNFARNKKCFRCEESRPKRELNPGEWECPSCNFLNFRRNKVCLKCNCDHPVDESSRFEDHAWKRPKEANITFKFGDDDDVVGDDEDDKEDGPKRVNFEDAEMKVGDWTCPKCQFMNFARNKKCFRCEESRPKRELNPGEWECPSCNFLNFRRNKVCLKCNSDHPVDESSQFEDHAWKKPKEANITFKFGDDDEKVGDDEDDILPLQKGENRFVVSKRATPAERRLTSARKRDSRS